MEHLSMFEPPLLSTRLRTSALLVFAVCLLTLLSAGTSLADGTYTPIHNFADGSVTDDGKQPDAGVIQGTDGNFYGETEDGGSGFFGAIYKMTPSGTVTILHNFGDGTVTNDGEYPEGGIIQASDGNF
jgi:uncharacterized repeat protein (TIGR03803 family)